MLKNPTKGKEFVKKIPKRKKAVSKKPINMYMPKPKGPMSKSEIK